jgi:hypothetical protein
MFRLVKIRKDKDGRVLWVKTKSFDRRGRMTEEKVMYGEAVEGRGCYVMKVRRDEDGSWKETVYCGADGKLVDNKQGWAIMRVSDTAGDFNSRYMKFDHNGKHIPEPDFGVKK